VKSDITGFFARIVQHEVDHLDGVLFIDRLTESARKAIDDDLFVLETDFESKQRTGSLKSQQEMVEDSLWWENKYS
jgi:peptide deformylase